MMTNPLKILLIEDDEVDRKFVARILKRDKANFDIHEAGDCATGIETVKQMYFDCILLDYQLPDGDGLTLLEHMLEANSIKAPIIFMTGKGDETLATLALKWGAADYIPKNKISPEVLLESIRNAIRIHELEIKSHLNQFELQESENQYQAIVEKFADIFFQLDKNRRIIYSSPATQKYLGYSSIELLGKPIDNLIEAGNMESILLEIATRRFGDRATTRLEVNLKMNGNSDLGESGKVRKVLLDSFGRWNLPHSYLTRVVGEKKFIGSLCLGRKLG